jgi:hypothetical protein
MPAATAPCGELRSVRERCGAPRRAMACLRHRIHVCRGPCASLPHAALPPIALVQRHCHDTPPQLSCGTVQCMASMLVRLQCTAVQLRSSSSWPQALQALMHDSWCPVALHMLTAGRTLQRRICMGVSCMPGGQQSGAGVRCERRHAPTHRQRVMPKGACAGSRAELRALRSLLESCID